MLRYLRLRNEALIRFFVNNILTWHNINSVHKAVQDNTRAEWPVVVSILFAFLGLMTFIFLMSIGDSVFHILASLYLNDSWYFSPGEGVLWVMVTQLGKFIKAGSAIKKFHLFPRPWTRPPKPFKLLSLQQKKNWGMPEKLLWKQRKIAKEKCH